MILIHIRSEQASRIQKQMLWGENPRRAVGLVTEQDWLKRWFASCRQIASGCWGKKRSSILLSNRLTRRDHKLPLRVTRPGLWAGGYPAPVGREGPLRCAGWRHMGWTELSLLFSVKSSQRISCQLIQFLRRDLSVSLGLGSGSLHLVNSAIRYPRVTKK